MAEKITTVGQLKRLALRGKADSAAQIAELAALVVAGLEDAQHVGITVTLPAANWSDRTQTIQHESLLADGGYWYFAYGGIGVNAADITRDGQVTFQCEDVPDVDLSMNIVRMGIETDGDPTHVGKVFNLTSNEDLKTYIDERFGDFYDALINERPIYFGLCDSDSKAILDNNSSGVAGRAIFKIK